MSDHRVRLDDNELALVCASLRARAAGLSESKRPYILRLAARLAECSPGNPYMIHGWVIKEEGHD